MPKKNLIPAEKKNVPVRREEYNPFALLRHEMNTLFDNFFRGFELEPFKGSFGAFSPSVDVKESDKDITVSAELPGSHSPVLCLYPPRSIRIKPRLNSRKAY